MLGARAGGNGLFLGEYAATPSVANADDLRGALVKGAFVPVSIAIHHGSPPTYEVAVNGIVDKGMLTVPDFASGYTNAELQIQLSNPNPTGTWRVAFDDWYCDAL